ncbi:MAG: c-type cytochrome domain-containing protein [Planctomycetota bacterium]|jgi:uncharacterized membrane protein
MDDLLGTFEAMGDPQMRHAALVHFPIALSALGVVVAAASALLKGKNVTLRWTAFAAYVVLVVVTLVAVRSGEAAHSELGGTSEVVHELVEEHEELGERAWLFAATAAVLLLIAARQKPVIRLTSSWLAVVVGVAGAGWVATTAHHGGELVYDHGVGTAASGTGTGGPGPSSNDPRVAFFREQVRPILSENCFRCHNPTRRDKAGGLDQTTAAGMLAGGESGAVVVPGDPDASLLILAVTWEDDLLQMPPDADKLPDESIEVMRRWVRDGAVWHTGTPEEQTED